MSFTDPLLSAGSAPSSDPGSESGCRGASASSAPWWPHGEQDGSRERLLASRVGLVEEAGPAGQDTCEGAHTHCLSK